MCEKNYVDKQFAFGVLDGKNIYQEVRVCGQQDTTKNPVNVSVSNKKGAFGGMFTTARLGMYITRVLYNDPVTIVFWSDGTKTMTRVQEGDTYNKETGLALCVLKKLTSGEQVANLIKTWVPTDEKVTSIDLRTVRGQK